MVGLRPLILKTVLTASVIVLMVGSLTPSKGTKDVPSVNDKILHFAAYAIVGIIAMSAFERTSNRVRFLLSLTLLGIALEFGQLFVPGRAFEFWDMAANGCGTFAAFTTARIFPSI